MAKEEVPGFWGKDQANSAVFNLGQHETLATTCAGEGIVETVRGST